MTLCLGYRSYICLWPCSLAVPVLAGWVYAFCGSLSRSSKGSSGFKASQKTGQRLKFSSDRLGEAGIDHILQL